MFWQCLSFRSWCCRIAVSVIHIDAYQLWTNKSPDFPPGSPKETESELLFFWKGHSEWQKNGNLSDITMDGTMVYQPKSIESIGVFLWQKQLCFQDLKMQKTCSMAFDSCHGIRCSKISWSCSSTWTNVLWKKKKWESTGSGFVAADMVVCQNLVPLVNIKIAGKWMFIPLKMVLIGIDPYPYLFSVLVLVGSSRTFASSLPPEEMVRYMVISFKVSGPHVGTKGNKHGMLPVSRLKELRWC